MGEIHFPTKPYTVVYKDSKTGDLKTVRRRPPPKLHKLLPKDTVELTSTKNLDWQDDQTYTIKHISYRSPNVIQLMNEEGRTTFVDHDQVKLMEKKGKRDIKQIDDPIQSEYLLWP